MPRLYFSEYTMFFNVLEFTISWQEKQSNYPYGLIKKLLYKTVTLKDKCHTRSVLYHCVLW